MVAIKSFVLIAASFLSVVTAQAWEADMFEVRDIFDEPELNLRDLSDHELAYLASRSGFDTIVRRASKSINFKEMANAAKEAGKTRQSVDSTVKSFKSRISPISHSLAGNAARKYDESMRSLDSANKAMNQALSSIEQLLSSSTKSAQSASKQIASRF